MNQYRRRLDALEGRLPKAAPRECPGLAAHDPEARALICAMATARATRRFQDLEQLTLQFAHRVRELYREKGLLP